MCFTPFEALALKMLMDLNRKTTEGTAFSWERGSLFEVGGRSIGQGYLGSNLVLPMSLCVVVGYL